MKVIILAAISVDGFIGLSDNHLSTKWTSKEDSVFFRSFSSDIGNIVVGSKTFQTFNRQMKNRKFFVYSNKDKVDNPFDNEIEIVKIDPRSLVNRLRQTGIKKLLIAGGSSIYTQFIRDRVVDELYLTIEPIIFGSGKKLFNESINEKLKLIKVIDLSPQTKVLHYKIIH